MMPALLALPNQILHQAIEGHSRRAYNDVEQAITLALEA